MMFSCELLSDVSLKCFNDITGIYNYMNIHYSENVDNALDKSSDELIHDATMYIEKHYMHDVSRDDVASFVHLSSSYFSMLFKQMTGKSFSDYLTAVRIKNAILLLESGVEPTLVYKKVGYNNNKYFVKNFAKLTLYTPAEYQEKFLKTGE